MTTSDQPQMELKNVEAQTALQNGLKGDFAQGIRTLPASIAGPDFARGERTMPPSPEGPDYAHGARTMPSSPKGPDYARGLRGKQGVG